MAVFYIRNAIEEIIHGRHPSQHIEYNVQSAKSSFFLEEGIWGTTSVYQGLQNVVVKLRPADGPEPEHSLLLNAHFDSVPNSPGAGDDGSMTVVMLELLRVFATSSTPFKHSVIFLFNGCEENILQGAHAFIKEHKWANTVRAFINLDSAGNGVREIMFQAGPKHPWLMNVSFITFLISYKIRLKYETIFN